MLLILTAGEQLGVLEAERRRTSERRSGQPGAGLSRGAEEEISWRALSRQGPPPEVLRTAEAAGTGS